MIEMKIEEVNGLINEVFKFIDTKTIEDMFIGISIPFAHDGFRLFIVKRIVDDSAFNCLKSIVRDCKLEMTDKFKEGYYTIYTPRKAI